MKRRMMFLLLSGILVLGGCGKQQTTPVVEEKVVEQTESEIGETGNFSSEQESSFEEETDMTETQQSETEVLVSQGEQSQKLTDKKGNTKKKKTVVSERNQAKEIDDQIIPLIDTDYLLQKETKKAEEKKNTNIAASNEEENQGTPSGTQEPVQAPIETPSKPQSDYKLVWSDDFNGNTLNEADWNYETHEPGWVNHELQSYEKNEENVYVKNGYLVIQPMKTVDENGNVSYTSGRINTQNKHDFKYGRMEARLKVPEGKGFLPAFWMMPTNEQLYGTWPKCGEIDIMEVLGHITNESYATLHFGEPHTSAQAKYTLKKGDFSKEFHVFACEWEPGLIKFYVDNQLIGTQNNWFTGKNGEAAYAYPAPYNQPFYLIFNVAVGGDWPQNPDETTTFDEKAQMVVDYVRVYQKDSYDENVTKPEEKVDLRDPDQNGNYVMNGDFTDDALGEDKAWNLLLAEGGKASAEIVNNALEITTTDCGKVDYSVQVVQPDIPLEKGYQYELSFEAKAEGIRTMKTAITAPLKGWGRYLDDTKVDLNTEKTTFTYTFDMTKASDANSRIEFNLGAQNATQKVTISNVSLKKLKKIEIVEQKPIQIDGTLQNGDFSNGDAGFEVYIDNNADAAYKVADEQMQVHIKNTGAPDDWYIQVKQNNLKLEKGKWYDISFDAKSDLDRKIMYALQKDGSSDNDWTPYSDSNFCELTAEYQNFHKTFKMDRDTDEKTILSITLGSVSGKQITDEHTVCIDNIVLKEVEQPEDTGKEDGKEEPKDDEDDQKAGAELIQNGDFSNGQENWEVYIDSNAKGSTEFAEQKAIYTIENRGNEDWHVQLKQGPIKFIKGKEYEICFTIKSDVDRMIKFAV